MEFTIYTGTVGNRVVMFHVLFARMTISDHLAILEVVADRVKDNPDKLHFLVYELTDLPLQHMSGLPVTRATSDVAELKERLHQIGVVIPDEKTRERLKVVLDVLYHIRGRKPLVDSTLQAVFDQIGFISE